MAESNSTEPPRCPCGFWGSVKTDGLCSKCYGEHKRQGQSSYDTGGGATFKASDLAKAFESVNSSTSTTNNDHSHTAGTLPTTNGSTDATTTLPGGTSLLGGGATNGTSTPTSSDTTPASANNAMSSSPAPRAATPASTQGDNETGGDAATAATDASDNGTAQTNTNKRDLPEDTTDPEHPPQKNKKRCFKCNCKLELALRQIGKCRCEYIFCQLHRLPEQHNCIYDHKTKGREEAREKMVSPKKHMGTSLKRIDSDS